LAVRPRRDSHLREEGGAVVVDTDLAFTTFSTWMLETHRLGEDGQERVGLANLLVSLLLGIAAVWVGRELGATL
jgi:CrcB-like protein, Camphor Resistance (CrcB)